jgi:hypothetical protein
VAGLHQLSATCHADIEVSDLLAKRIAVDSQEIGATGLIPCGRIQRDLYQRDSTSCSILS